MKNTIQTKGSIAFLLLGIITVLIIGGSVYLYLSSSKDKTYTMSENSESNSETNKTTNVDTSEWIQYRNDEFGFEFKYPKSENISQESKEGDLRDPAHIGYLVQISSNDPSYHDITFQIVKRDAISYTDLAKYTSDKNTVTDKVINGYRAKESISIYPMQTKSSPIEGYYKDVVLYIEKSPNVIANVNFRSPVFKTETEARNYNTANFEAFLSTIKVN